MTISTNSIIHYTNSFKTLSSILKEGFKIKYCVEELELDETGSHAAHPMVSFCDIPLSDSTQHFAAYGKYGLGLSKSWAVSNGVSPVIYISQSSLLAKCIEELLVERRKDDSNLTAKQKSEILRIKSYAKNYSGFLKRKGVNNPEYKFYDEREWRLVPSKDKIADANFSISKAAYEKDKAKYNKKIENCRVEFSPNDISYIIVKNTSEIPKMTNIIRAIYANKCTADELDVLFSKICSTEQIAADY